MNCKHSKNGKQRFSNGIENYFNQSISEILGSDFTSNIPSANIIETEEDYKIELAVPGLEKKDLDIRIEKDRLIVQTKGLEEKTSDKTIKTTRKEFDYRSFKRSFVLNNTINKKKVTASHKLGILKISLAKKEAVKDMGPKTIIIK